MPATRGKIKTLTEKGFGFISMGNGQKDLFFHLRNLSNVRFDELQVGDSMEFDVATGEKGPFAENVVRVEE